MDNYTPNLFMTQPIYDPTHPFATRIKDPLKFATDYFPLNFHQIPEHNGKNLNYYSAILFHEKLVFFKSILDKIDKSKIIYHSVFILNIVTEEKWGLRPTKRKLQNFTCLHVFI